MVAPQSGTPDVYSAGEIARVAGVAPRVVRSLADSGFARPVRGPYFGEADAVRLVRRLRGIDAFAQVETPTPHRAPRRRLVVTAGTSAALHAALFMVFMGLSGMNGFAGRVRAAAVDRPMRLVYLVAPGPGGGGGGGGAHETTVPAAAVKGPQVLHSPVSIRRPPLPVEPPRVVHAVVRTPSLLAADHAVAAAQVAPAVLPPVVAPVIPAAADPRDHAGLPWRDATPNTESRGAGAGGGIGSGTGTGLGAGDGAGLGDGSGAGTGGGPYRAGSGVTPPSMLHEVKPDYTEEARRQNIEGDVDLEIVVRSDGTVGQVTVLHGLGAGLDQRAVDAVRQWRFAPAHFKGAAVDVIVQVAVEFKLR